MVGAMKPKPEPWKLQLLVGVTYAQKRALRRRIANDRRRHGPGDDPNDGIHIPVGENHGN